MDYSVQLAKITGNFIPCKVHHEKKSQIKMQ